MVLNSHRLVLFHTSLFSKLAESRMKAIPGNCQAQGTYGGSREQKSENGLRSVEIELRHVSSDNYACALTKVIHGYLKKGSQLFVTSLLIGQWYHVSCPKMSRGKFLRAWSSLF